MNLTNGVYLAAKMVATNFYHLNQLATIGPAGSG